MKHSAADRSRKHRAAEARRLRSPAPDTSPATRVPTAPAALALARQNTDLTAEGSPPPGKVGLDGPVMPQTGADKAPATPAVPVAKG